MIIKILERNPLVGQKHTIPCAGFCKGKPATRYAYYDEATIHLGIYVCDDCNPETVMQSISDHVMHPNG